MCVVNYGVCVLVWVCVVQLAIGHMCCKIGGTCSTVGNGGYVCCDGGMCFASGNRGYVL